MNDIVSYETAEEFAKATMGLIFIKDYLDFRAAADRIIAKWPGCRVWLEWWIFHRSAKKLFPAVGTMPENISEVLPNSTNAQESMHNIFYLAAERNQNILSG